MITSSPENQITGDVPPTQIQSRIEELKMMYAAPDSKTVCNPDALSMFGMNFLPIFGSENLKKLEIPHFDLKPDVVQCLSKLRNLYSLTIEKLNL